MVKNVIREILIVLLLLFAISLILGIIFYDYIPNNKTVPIEVKEYAMPEDIKEELDAAITKDQRIVKTLFIDSRDLNMYESIKEYNKGKANPFKDYGQNEKQENTIGNNSVGENNIQKEDYGMNTGKQK